MSENTASKEEHWNRTKGLMMLHIAIWFVLSFGVHVFAPELNDVSFMHFPLGYYMAAQGSLFIFVVQLFIFVKQQDKIDRDCGMAED